LPLWTVRSRNFELRAVAFLPDSTRVLVVEENIDRDPDRQELPKYSSVLTVRDESTGELITENSDVREFDNLQQVAVGGTEPIGVLAYPHELHTYKLAELIAEPPKRLSDLTGLASWRMRPQRRPRVIQTEWPSLRGLAFHPSGRFLLTVTEEPSVTVWDTETWTVTREFDCRPATYARSVCRGMGFSRVLGVTPESSRFGIGKTDFARSERCCLSNDGPAPEASEAGQYRSRMLRRPASASATPARKSETSDRPNMPRRRRLVADI
jgi:hypothetical protein